jgi:hypothetical protein
MIVMINNYLMVYLTVRKARANVKHLEGTDIKTNEIIANDGSMTNSQQKKEPSQRLSIGANIIKAKVTSKTDKTDAIEHEVFMLCVAVSMTFVTCWSLMSLLLLWKLIAQGPAPLLLDYLAVYSASLDFSLGAVVLGKRKVGNIQAKGLTPLF